jgi:hypothetical protein
MSLLTTAAEALKDSQAAENQYSCLQLSAFGRLAEPELSDYVCEHSLHSVQTHMGAE